MHCVDLGESFPKSIYLQKSASIQPRTSPSKFGGKYSILFNRVLSVDPDTAVWNRNFPRDLRRHVLGGGGGCCSARSQLYQRLHQEPSAPLTQIVSRLRRQRQASLEACFLETDFLAADLIGARKSAYETLDVPPTSQIRRNLAEFCELFS